MKKALIIVLFVFLSGSVFARSEETLAAYIEYAKALKLLSPYLERLIKPETSLPPSREWIAEFQSVMSNASDAALAAEMTAVFERSLNDNGKIYAGVVTSSTARAYGVSMRLNSSMKENDFLEVMKSLRDDLVMAMQYASYIISGLNK